MKFTKMHGAGNDYALIDARGREDDWPQLARALCDRHYGVGADGLLLALPSTRAHAMMRMFNPDGSEAEMCGNGIRCFARFVLERGIASTTSTLRVETLNGVLTVEPLQEDGAITRARVSMGKPRLEPREIPVSLPEDATPAILNHPLEVEGHLLHLAFVSMGNPHAVAFINAPVDAFPLRTVGPRVEHHAMFPDRINLEVVNVVARDRVRARTWERGAGETLACGTGACAIAVAGRLLGHTGNRVDVELTGGTLTIEWDGCGEVYLTGPIAEVFEGEWEG